ncbi:MAG: glycosyltransferase family 4 protein [Gemmatimonadota bacterium]|nr:glycosyltransferase family 4 protein [Gemmatimonadota bacterium]MDH3427785.1 glycosyltransferase family 4 protein [Gemmatimonadota bacterium]
MRPRLLFASQTLPFPPDSGVKTRAYHTLRILSSAFDVTALCFYRRRQTGGAAGVRAAVEGLQDYAGVTAFPIPQEWSRLRGARDHLASLLRRKPYTDFVFEHRGFGATFSRHIERGRYSIVHLESQALGRYTDGGIGVRSVCVHHNVESELLRRRAAVLRNPVASAYLRSQAGLLRSAESTRSPAFDLNIAVSDEDAAEFSSIAPTARFVTVPNGVDTDHFRPADTPTDGIALLGGTDWFPNLDGLQHFVDEILPLVRSRLPNVRVVSVGRARDSEIQRFRKQHDVALTGYVHDIRPWIQGSRCVVVPLRAGGGSRLKILDAWAMGKPVVTTSIGCEGLPAVDGDNALVCDDPTAFADAVVRVLNDAQLERRLSRAARAVAVRSYSWDAIGERMLSVYRGLLESS